VQRIVGLLTLVSIGLVAAYLATRSVLGVRLLGTDPQTALLVPLDLVEFLLEVVARSMFVTVLGADLFMRFNLAAWQNTRAFAGTPAEDDYNRVMNEFARIA
jgi:hypothetical protein